MGTVIETDRVTFTYISCIPPGTTFRALPSALHDCLYNPGNSTVLGRPPILLLCTLTYLSTLLTLHTALRGRKASFATHPLFTTIAATHNIVLALASLAMHIDVTLSLYHNPRICAPPTREQSHVLYLFFVSKLYEYFDTVLLLLRGRRVSLLHLWHHTSVAWEVHGWLEHGFSLGLSGMWFNTLIHVVMYSYYACALLKVRFPFKRAITLSQIVQFLTGFASLAPYFYYNSRTPGGCHGKPAFLLTIICNTSFLLLFIRFYFFTYSDNKNKKSQ